MAHDLDARAVSEHARERFVAVHQLAIQRAPINPRKIALKQQPIALLTAAKRFFSGALLGDVMHQRHHCQHRAGGIDQRRE